jgi:predicted ArsR family transcriptional regulator
MQLNIFDTPYQAHSETSRGAAQAIAGKAKSLRELVFEALTVKPMTDEQIATCLNLNPSTARPRRVELQRAGRIREHSRALTSSGRSAVVWSVA